MKYDDLLGVPFKTRGRDKKGMDCYGLVLECLRREGKSLPDFYYMTDKEPASAAPEYAARTGARPGQCKPGALAEYENRDGSLHVGYMVDGDNMLHMTYSGVRISPVGIFKHVTFYEV